MSDYPVFAGALVVVLALVSLAGAVTALLWLSGDIRELRGRCDNLTERVTRLESAPPNSLAAMKERDAYLDSIAVLARARLEVATAQERLDAMQSLLSRKVEK